MVRQVKKLSPFGEILSVFMTNRGLSTRTLASIAAVSPASIQDWRKGVNPTDYLAVARLADYFGVSMRFMLTGNDESQKDMDDQEWPQTLTPGDHIFSGLCEITIRKLEHFDERPLIPNADNVQKVLPNES